MSQAAKPISKPIDSSENQQNGHRQIVFSVEPGEKKFWLKLQDTHYTWNYIPLGAVPSSAKGQHPKGANVLVPVIPLSYTTPDAAPKQATTLRKGWLYVFRNGQLWRELEIGDSGYLRDVNLEHNQKKEVRQATGTFDNRVLLPYKVLGEKQTIEMAFAEIQWSWARINKLQTDASLRRNRMQEIDLSGNDAKFPTMPANGNKARIENVNKAPELYALTMQRQSNIPVVYLHDPLRIADNYVDAFFTVESELAEVIKGLPLLKPIENREEIKAFSPEDKQAYYRAAVMAYRTFFDPKLAKGTRKFLVKGTVTTTEADTSIGKIAKELDNAYLEDILAVKKRKELRAQIREIKRIYVEFLEGKFEGQDIRAKHADFIDANAALLDFASLEGIACFRLWDKTKDLIGFLNHDPSVIDSAHDITSLVESERPKPENDPGNRYLEGLLDSAHPLHKVLFPSSEQIDVYKEELDLDLKPNQQPELSDGSGIFRPAAFAGAVAAARQPPRGIDKALKDIFGQSEKIVADIVSSFQKQWQHAMKSSNTVRIEPLLRLVKGAKIPELAGMHIAKAGSSLDGHIVIDGKLRLMEVLNRHQRRSASASGGKLTHEFINIIDPRTNTVIGSQKISDLGNFKGVTPKVTEQSWTELWGKSGKVGNGFKIVQTHADLVVVPEASPYVVKYHNPDAVSISGVRNSVKALRVTSKTFPSLVAVMEGWNLWQAFSSIMQSGRDSSGKTVSTAIVALPAVAYASTDALIKIGGEDAIANRIANFGKFGKIGSNVVKGSIRIFGQEIKIFGALGSGVAGLTAIMAAWEMLESLQQADEDAATGHGIAMAGSVGVALAGLGASGVTMFSAIGPYGWAFLGVAILGSLLAYGLTDTDLEKWAKHGAFSKNQKIRMTNEYADKLPQYVLDRFMAMLMQPNINMRTDTATENKNQQGTSNKEIVVEVFAPGFETELSTLDVQVTIEEGEIDVRGFQAVITRLSGKQQSQTPYLIEQIYPDKHSQQVVGVRYRYRLRAQNLVQVRARARHITKDQTILPPVPLGSKATNGELMANYAPTNNSISSQQPGIINNGDHIIDTVPGWVYAKL